jgi:hypothetical protein
MGIARQGAWNGGIMAGRPGAGIDRGQVMRDAEYTDHA